MKSICYVVPYFGKLPNNFQLWLNSCAANSTIDWLIFTDDRTKYEYPTNVNVNYCKFSDIQRLIQQQYSFEVRINSYWHLSLFKPAYGEIFAEYLKKYDFWGYCDVDLMWGNIRKFITEQVLSEYDKIGFQGHSTIYRNNKKVNSRYKTIIPNHISYKEVFSGQTRYSFDENGMNDIYDYLGIPYFKTVNFAHLSKYEYSFYLWHLPEKYNYKNKRQIFIYDNGSLIRYYLDRQNNIKSEEFMYIHFFCRPMAYKATGIEKNKRYIIYPDVLECYDGEVTKKLVNKKGKKSAFFYYVSSIWYNRKKITIKRIIFNTKEMLKRRIGK